MFWRTLDTAAAHADAMLNAYRQLDTALGHALNASASTDTTLLVMSDHGFAPWKRSVELNSWLHSEGLLALNAGAAVGGELFADVDWTRTRAYGLGLNGLYLNLQGRERFGAVLPGERELLRADLSQRLLAWRDPQTGDNVVSRVYRREEVYSPAYRDLAPDLIVGYRRGYRVSNESALGSVPAALIDDNHKKWSGDHCMAAEEVPGVLLSNRPIASRPLGLQDMAPTVLGEFGIPVPKQMVGRSVFDQGSAERSPREVKHVQ